MFSHFFFLQFKNLRCFLFYYIKFVSDLQQVNGLLWVLRFLSTNKTDNHNITEILLKVVLNTITLILFYYI